MPADRYLYVARHAEATPDETRLTPRGRAQATALGRRLRDIPFTAIHHGPLPRATETAHLVAEQLTHPVVPHPAPEAGDYLPYVPTDIPPHLADFLAQFTPEEHTQGPHLATQALTLIHYTSTTTNLLLHNNTQHLDD
ncbi:hypothetical protein HPO96_28420 [Kribbella sandramycini]|uniref:Broad specificity phosphatase PhoE n=1 Tax=Kribbella sandramycini TaxID=60450 RepID=A0A7Y4P3I0_9ACTN|nr:histidine phosphatase family protein [Kribbella sandramycini]MBB6571530.1 broad specificity phosphatase PhoE [Kribbella sandramycini]NOL44179.1 hypothetical protein [Kribbella sandramycini]